MKYHGTFHGQPQFCRLHSTRLANLSTSRDFVVSKRPMPNKFYSPGEQRAEKVHELFDTIARRYDLMNDVMSFGLHRRWKRRVAQLGNPRPGDRALDVCCGTGDLSISLAAQGADVVGLDFSEHMLAEARAKAETQSRNAKLQTPKFTTGDAQSLPFADNTFDLITIGYGLRNLASWETGLKEMVRVARPGARLIVLDFGKPDNPLWRSIYFTYLKLFVPLCGLIFCGNAGAYAYILESLKHFPAQRGVDAKMRESGLTNVRIHNCLGGAMGINYGEKARGGE